MCFRSKRRYAADAAIDVAVPYSPDAANIFLPARVVYSEEMPKAGLFRHGTEYRRTSAPAPGDLSCGCCRRRRVTVHKFFWRACARRQTLGKSRH